MKRVIIILAFSFLFVTSCNHAERKTSYRIARSIHWEQMPLYGAEKNLLGFSDDLIYEIAKLENFRVQLLFYNQMQLIQALNIKDIDAVLTSMQPTHDLLKNYLFSNPYFIVGPMLLVRKEDSFKNLEDLADRSVGLERNYTLPLTLPGAGGCVFHQYEDITNAVEDLNRGYIDAVVLDAIAAERLSTGLYRNSVKIAGPPLVNVGIYLVVKKGKSEELVKMFDAGLDHIKKEGLYPKMLYYWDLFDALHPITLP